MTQDPNNLIWIYLEMTGLDTASDHILEISTIVTEGQLPIRDACPVRASHPPDAVMSGMDEWNTRQHGQSGLTERVRNSTLGVQDAERETIAFLEQYVPANASPMCGNSICQDRRFMARCMPDLERYFHYRNLDVSSIKELVKRWSPNIAGGFKKSSTHLALDDTRDSIRELVYYREYFFK